MMPHLPKFKWETWLTLSLVCLFICSGPGLAPVSCHCVLLLTSRGCQLPVPGLCSPPMFSCPPRVDVLLTLRRTPPRCSSSPSSGPDPSRWGGIEGPWDRQGRQWIGPGEGLAGARAPLVLEQPSMVVPSWAQVARPFCPHRT